MLLRCCAGLSLMCVASSRVRAGQARYRDDDLFIQCGARCDSHRVRGSDGCACARAPASPPPPPGVTRAQGFIVPPRGPTAFGWDPVFQPAGFAQTYAEMDKALKNSISHRYRSLVAMQDHLLAHRAEVEAAIDATAAAAAAAAAHVVPAAAGAAAGAAHAPAGADMT